MHTHRYIHKPMLPTDKRVYKDTSIASIMEKAFVWEIVPNVKEVQTRAQTDTISLAHCMSERERYFDGQGKAVTVRKRERLRERERERERETNIERKTNRKRESGVCEGERESKSESVCLLLLFRQTSCQWEFILPIFHSRSLAFTEIEKTTKKIWSAKSEQLTSTQLTNANEQVIG